MPRKVTVTNTFIIHDDEANYFAQDENGTPFAYTNAPEVRIDCYACTFGAYETVTLENWQSTLTKLESVEPDWDSLRGTKVWVSDNRFHWSKRELVGGFVHKDGAMRFICLTESRTDACMWKHASLTNPNAKQ